MKQETKASKNVPFSKDRPFLLGVVIISALMSVNVLSVLLRLRPNDFKIPVQYIVYDGTVVQSGNWFSLYSLVLFVVVGGVVSIIMAQRLHKANKMFSIVTLVVYGLMAVFSFFSINALLGLVGRV